MFAQRLNYWPILGPLAREGYHLAQRALHRSRDYERIHRLADCGVPYASAIAHALRQFVRSLPPDEEQALQRIEAERRALLRDWSPLINGRLGEDARFDQVTVRRACQVSKPAKPARLLYALIRALTPTTVLELGTNVGISSAYQAMALRYNGGHGQLTTLERSPYRLDLAQAMHRRLGLTNVRYVPGLFADTLRAAFDNGPIDMAFIDGHHDYRPTLDYFHQIRAHAHDGALIVFDDIHWSEGMQLAWVAIDNSPWVELAVDLHSMGLCIVRQEPVTTRYRLPKIRGLLC
jgi:predicted O-methyltransferase YrrM